tara:strand:- start:202 stop:408 length:207 start_codon:yes stop_codon:yes gene_type:complete
VATGKDLLGKQNVYPQDEGISYYIPPNPKGDEDSGKISLPHEISIDDTTASRRGAIINRDYLLDIKQI